MSEPWLDSAWQLLRQRRDDDRLAHALLIHGPAGIGKRVLAGRFIALLLCERPEPAGACGACRGCTLLAASTHPDFHAVRPEENSRQIRVDAIRELSRKVALTSSHGGYQVFLIDPADCLNTNAANAFLKTLEEPRPDTLLLLLVEARSQLPVTVLSRCQQVAVPVPPRDQALTWLKAEAPDADARALQLALDAADGAPRVALTLLQQGAIDAYPETLRDLDALARGTADPINVAQRWSTSEPSLRLTWMARALRDSCWQQAGVGESGLTVTRDLASLTALESETNRTRRLLSSNLRPELLIESLLLDWMKGKARMPGGRSW